MIGMLLSLTLAAAPAVPQAKPSPEAVVAAARCVVESDRKNVLQLLATLPGSPEERRWAKLVGDMFHACADGRITSGFDGRAAIAAALVEERLSSGDGDYSKVTVTTPWYAAAMQGRTAGKDYDAVELGIQEFGTCVVRAAPQESADLLASVFGGAGEASAAEALKPALPGCIVQGQTLRFDAFDLRLMLAEPFYHATAR